jgi:hypothetical protein
MHQGERGSPSRQKRVSSLRKRNTGRKGAASRELKPVSASRAQSFCAPGQATSVLYPCGTCTASRSISGPSLAHSWRIVTSNSSRLTDPAAAGKPAEDGGGALRAAEPCVSTHQRVSRARSRRLPARATRRRRRPARLAPPRRSAFSSATPFAFPSLQGRNAISPSRLTEAIKRSPIADWLRII